MRSLCSFNIPVLAFLISITFPSLPRIPVFKIPTIPGLTLNLRVPVLGFSLTINWPSLRVPVIVLPTLPGFTLKLQIPLLGFSLTINWPALPRVPIFLLPPCPLDALRGNAANDNSQSQAA